MVAGKMKKLAMGIQSSPSSASSRTMETPQSKPPSRSPSSGKVPSKGALFSRSFGVYFPRSSAQVQPRPPDVAELLCLVEQLRESECRLRTEILELKLLKESVAIVPVLESQICAKDATIEELSMRMLALEAENGRLREEADAWRTKAEGEREASNKSRKDMEMEIAELKKLVSKEADETDELLSSPWLSSQRFQRLIDTPVKSNLSKNIKGKGTWWTDCCSSQENAMVESGDLKKDEAEPVRSIHARCDSEEIAETPDSVSASVKSRAPRVPKPPPRPSSSSPPSSAGSSGVPVARASAEQSFPPPPHPVKLASPPPPPPPPSKAVPPPPPPAPRAKGIKWFPAKVRRVPEVVEFYHSLMKRESSRRDSLAGAPDASPATVSARDMIGEIENRSAYLHAIKTDVETQGDFIRFLIKEVENAAFTNIEDVVPFVKWLDDELSYLVDERAVLKHFDWPEQKADALREAAFGYSDLKKLESEASSFHDHPRQPCGPALKKMQALFEKLEHGVYSLSRLRESATNRYRVFKIPTDWMLESGLVSQIKLASVKLAMKYMRRVSGELESGGGGCPEDEDLIVQGVRFAFRVHQFAGGFDAETMRAFQEMRDKARSSGHSRWPESHRRREFVCKP